MRKAIGLSIAFSGVLLANCGSPDASLVDAKTTPAADAITAPDSQPQDDTYFGACGTATPQLVCEVDLTGVTSCSHTASMNVTTHDAIGNRPGVINFRLDFGSYDVVSAVVTAQNPTDYWLTLGNSSSNDGWGGDGGLESFEHDSEFFFENDKMHVFASDKGQTQQLAEDPNAFGASGEVSLAVCDGNLSVKTPLVERSITSPFVFQVDGDEPDNQSDSGLNDRVVYLGLNRFANTGFFRLGTGAESATITFSSY